MFDPANLNGRLAVFAIKPELLLPGPDGKATRSTYNDGEYFVVSSTRNVAQVVKPVTGYGCHEVKTLTAQEYDVIDSYRDDAVVRDWIVETHNWIEDAQRGKKQYVDYVYSNAASAIRRVSRALASLTVDETCGDTCEQACDAPTEPVVTINVPAGYSVVVNGRAI